MSSTAVILFAHGAREPEWAQPFESISDRLRAAGMTVELAFLEVMSPSLERVRKNHAKTEFRVTSALGEAPEIVAAISDWVQRKAR